MLVRRVAVDAEPAVDDRGAGQAGEEVGEERAQLHLDRGGDLALVLVHRHVDPGAVVSDLDDPGGHREAIETGSREVGAEDREAIGGEVAPVLGAQVKDRLAARPERAGQPRAEERGPGARRDQHVVGLDRAAGGEEPSFGIDAARRAALAHLDAERAGLGEDALDHPAGLDPAALRVEVAVDQPARAIGREAARDGGGVEPLEAVTAAGEEGEAVVLEAARLEGAAREERHSGLVEERLRRVPVPGAPAVERALGQRGVELVSAVVEPHDLADVGRLGERVGQGTRVDQRHLVAAARQGEGGGGAEDPATGNGDAHDANLLQIAAPSAVLAC